jgi:integrase
MSVKVRPYRRGGWEVDIRIVWPDGTAGRERRRAPTSSRSGAVRWAEARERHLLVRGKPVLKKEVPTLAEFASRFLDRYARANQQKPSTIVGKESVLRVHLIPLLGAKKLDAITNEDVQALKSRLRQRAPNTVNRVLNVLSTLLKKAVEWSLIDHMPCTIPLLVVPTVSVGFFDFADFERLVAGAKATGQRAYLIALLGGEAGLRCGEMIGLEWTDVDSDRRQLCVRQSDWRGHIVVPKGGRLRHVPMTIRLATALTEHGQGQSARVLCQADGSPMTHGTVREDVRRAAKRGGLTITGVHRLRHTFCSHLAMRGAPARAIQELAGHRDLSTTQRYMHLSHAVIESSIRLLDRGRIGPSVGDILETGISKGSNSRQDAT